MLAALISQTPPPTGFSPTGLIIVLVVAAIVYPLQKKLRESVSRERKERWTRENPDDVTSAESSSQDLGDESPWTEPGARPRPGETDSSDGAR